MTGRWSEPVVFLRSLGLSAIEGVCAGSVVTLVARPRAPWIRAGGRSVRAARGRRGSSVGFGRERPEVTQLAGHAPGAESTSSTTRPGRALVRHFDLERLQQVTTVICPSSST